MPGLGLAIPDVAALAPRSGAVSIATNSIVLASASSQYLSATGKAGINQQKFTFNKWTKFAGVGVKQVLLYFGDGTTSNEVVIQLLATNVLQLLCETGGTAVLNLQTTQTFTDVTNWHNIQVDVDTTQATSTNRARIWYDGTQITSFGTATYPAQNTNLSNNFASSYRLGANQTPANFENAKDAQVYYIDGQQLPPSSFITGTPGVPKNYSGAYSGAFDFFLPFSNAGALGTDGSGEGNAWTPQNAPTQSSDHP